jgi:dephospho-CoA kinase
MKRLGITGGIASGKTAVAGMLREMGFQVIDADGLGHSVIEPGTRAYEEIVAEFGAGVVGADGRIDRGKLGAIAFADAEKLKRLNAIVHPRVEEEMVRQFAEWEKSGVSDAAFVEAALLVEAEYQKNLDGLVPARTADGAIVGTGIERSGGAEANCGADASGGEVEVRYGEDRLFGVVGRDAAASRGVGHKVEARSRGERLREEERAGTALRGSG